MASASRSFGFSLLVTAASFTVLSACSMHEITSSLTGTEGRKPQMVDGPRRNPLLNPPLAPMENPGQPPAAMAPAPSQHMAPPPAQEMTPFDQFDERGNEVEPQAQNGQTTDYFSRFFGGQDTPVNDSTMRKPIPENIEGMGDQPAVAAPVYNAPAPVQLQAQAPTPVVPMTYDEPSRTVPAFSPMVDEAPAATYQSPLADAQPVEERELASADMQQGQDQPSFFSRFFNSFKSEPDQATAPAPSADASMTLQDASEYPSLSSVPPTPDTFQAIRNEREQRTQEMMTDHALAQESKQMLDAEPSQMQADVPVAAAPAAAPAPVALHSPASAAGDFGEPVLLGEIGDTSRTPAVAVKAEPQVQSVAAPVEYAVDKPVAAPVVVAEPVAQEPEQKTSWWKGWNIMGGKDGDAAAQAEPMEMESAAPETAPAAKPLIIADEPESTVPAFTPLMETQPQPVPAPAPVPVRSMAAGEPAGEEEAADQAPAAGSNAALPSPNMLGKVKTLPPSRYQSRDRQYYLVP